MRTSVRFLREERWASTRSWWPGGSQKAIDDNGGKYIAGGFNKTFSISGQPPADRVVILQFENMDKVKAWRDAARDAQEKIGSKYATFRTFAVEGVAQY